MKEFIYQRYHLSDIALKELTPAFITDFDMFLRVDKHCCNNTVWIYTCPLRTMVSISINNGWLIRDPFREYEIQKEDTERGFLTREEINLLMNGKLKNAKQKLIRDLFLFCCFTGVSFADMRNLSEENLRTYFDEHLWIYMHRQKTGVQSNAKVFIGVFVGMVLGVPITSYIASEVSFTMGMMFFTVVNALVFVVTIFFVPSIPVKEKLSYGVLLSVLKRKITWYSISVLLLIYGLANIIGNVIAGKQLAVFSSVHVRL